MFNMLTNVHHYTLVILGLYIYTVDSATTVTTTASTTTTLGSVDATRSMVIGLAAGFGSFVVVGICCCLAFKCCGCFKDVRVRPLMSGKVRHIHVQSA